MKSQARYNRQIKVSKTYKLLSLILYISFVVGIYSAMRFENDSLFMFSECCGALGFLMICFADKFI